MSRTKERLNVLWLCLCHRRDRHSLRKRDRVCQVTGKKRKKATHDKKSRKKERVNVLWLGLCRRRDIFLAIGTAR